MKFKHYLIVFIASFGLSLFFASCLNDDNKIPPNCYDLILNNGEEGIDCGGPCEQECNHCINGIYEPNKGETWVDCGGPCPVCAQCSNGILDGDETGIDCGGSCGGCELLCGDGLLNGNEDEIDCEYDGEGDESCPLCPTCTDGIMNGTEAGIDCGGTNCAPCCTSGNCKNGAADGNEFWIDCGGSTCPDCVDTLYWKIGAGNVPYHSIAITASDIVETAENITISVGPSNLEGNLNLMFTKSNLVGQVWSLAGTNATLTYTDISGTYGPNPALTANGNVVVVKQPTTATAQNNRNPVVIPDNDFDGCHKPTGTYTFYRVSFSGPLYNIMDPTLPPIQLNDGLFQFTFFVP